jgi:hypothetical protein
VPEIINDSTAIFDSELVYSYKKEQLVKVITNIFKADRTYTYSCDSIIYLNKDSVEVRRIIEGKNILFKMKTKDFFKMLLNSNGACLSDNIILKCNSDNGCWYREISRTHHVLSFGQPNGGLWYYDFHFYTNDIGLVVRYGVESDTNASVTIFEYEKAYNPYHFYYTFTFRK